MTATLTTTVTDDNGDQHSPLTSRPRAGPEFPVSPQSLHLLHQGLDLLVLVAQLCLLLCQLCLLVTQLCLLVSQLLLHSLHCLKPKDMHSLKTSCPRHAQSENQVVQDMHSLYSLKPKLYKTCTVCTV